jgi:hypothetical protein
MYLYLMCVQVDTADGAQPSSSRSGPSTLPTNASPGREVSKYGFVAAAIREISVGLCPRNYQMYRASLGLLVGVSGHGFREGAAHPTEEVL